MIGIADKKTSINAAAVALAFAMPLGSSPMYMGWDLAAPDCGSGFMILTLRKPTKDLPDKRAKVKAQRKQANKNRRHK